MLKETKFGLLTLIDYSNLNDQSIKYNLLQFLEKKIELD